MERKFLQTITCLLIIILLIPVTSFALGGYVVVKGFDEYHSALCENLNGYNLKDAKWYKTLNEVEKTGLRAAPCCYDSGYDYEDDGASNWNSDDWKTDNIFEIERMWGVFSGYDIGVEEGYDAGYEEGYNIGLSEGEEIGYSSAQEEYEATKDDLIFTYVGIALISFIIGALFNGRKSEDELRKQRAEIIKYEALLKIYKDK